MSVPLPPYPANCCQVPANQSGGSPSASSDVIFSDLDPNGLFDGKQGSLCTSSDGRFWTKTTATGTKTGWLELLGAPS